MADWRPSWPTRAEYDRAVMSWRQTMRDPDLTRGQLATVMGTDPRRFGGAGLYVSVYRIGDWQVRCFCSNVATRSDPPRDIAERYQKIARFIAERHAQLPALLPTSYIAEGIYVSGRWCPVIKSAWVKDAMRLGGFIFEHRGNAQMMAALAEAWLRMVFELERAPMAHGDLDLTNVLVQLNGLQPVLRLIDYDNVWIPALDGRPQTECGHEPFQHPHFFRPLPIPDPANRPFNKLMDRFSALVMYLSLLALSIEPRLYAELGASEDDWLLFTRADYEQPTLETSNIMLVRKRCGPRVEPFVNELVACLAENRMPRPLEALIGGASGAVPSGAPSQRRAPPPPPPAAVPTGYRVPLGSGISQVPHASAPPVSHPSAGSAPIWPVAQPQQSHPASGAAPQIHLQVAYPPQQHAPPAGSPQGQQAPMWPARPAQPSRGCAGSFIWLVIAVVALLALLMATGVLHL